MLSTKTEYAIRGLVELAGAQEKRPVAVREVSERQNLPAKYMEHIFKSLKSAGILKSIKGAAGGYILQKSPDEISLQEIMSAIAEEPVSLNCHGREGIREYCVGLPCDFLSVWIEIEKELENHLAEIKLSRFIVNNEERI
jgi:Rrf2 family iron-sulfur cluster assembly transcriptional regulator